MFMKYNFTSLVLIHQADMTSQDLEELMFGSSSREDGSEPHGFSTTPGSPKTPLTATKMTPFEQQEQAVATRAEAELPKQGHGVEIVSPFRASRKDIRDFTIIYNATFGSDMGFGAGPDFEKK